MTRATSVIPTEFNFGGVTRINRMNAEFFWASRRDLSGNRSGDQ